jgi:hypothetical protein
MRRTRTIAALAAALVAVGVGAPTAASAASDASPAQLCKETGNFEGYLASTGGCASSVASIGVEALFVDFAFPSQAAAVANCAQIKEWVGGFPYYFYGREGDDRYLATNNRTCVAILYGLHTGALEPGPA